MATRRARREKDLQRFLAKSTLTPETAAVTPAEEWAVLTLALPAVALDLVVQFSADRFGAPCYANEEPWQEGKTVRSKLFACDTECTTGSWFGRYAFMKRGTDPQLLSEFEVHMAIPRHPHVLSLIAVIMDEQKLLALVFESSKQCRSLRDLTHKVPPFEIDDELALAWCLDLTLGLAHLHAHGWMHHDLHSGNALVLDELTHSAFHRPRLVICDLGIAERVDAQGCVRSVATNVDGHPGSITPEQEQEKQPITLAADIWNLGSQFFAICIAAVGSRRQIDYFAQRKLLQSSTILIALQAIAARCQTKEPSARPPLSGVQAALTFLRDESCKTNNEALRK